MVERNLSSTFNQILQIANLENIFKIAYVMSYDNSTVAS